MRMDRIASKTVPANSCLNPVISPSLEDSASGLPVERRNGSAPKGRLLSAFMAGLCFFLLCWPVSRVWGLDAIRWAYFPFPPMFIEDGGAVGGFGVDVLEILKREMPKYAHEFVQMPPRRILETMRAGENVCTYGVLRTPDRETYLRYSLPCRLTPPPILIMRKEDAFKIAPRRSISLRKLLEDGSVSLGLTKGVSFGPEVDAMLAEESQSNVKHFFHMDLGEHIYEMLHAKRIDATVDDAFQHVYMITKYDWRQDFDWARIEEAPSWRVGHVACPDTEWGRRVIERVDAVLRREIMDGRLRGLMELYSIDEMQSEFRREYDALIASAAEAATGDVINAP